MKSLALSGVSVRFGREVQALADVSVALAAGEVVALVGPNGAGKSTLARVLLGLVRPDAGVLEVDGRVQPVNNAFKRSIGYLPEAPAFSENLRGRQVLRFFAWARGVGRARVDEALERVGLAGAAGRPVRGYSKGMRQRLGLAVAILAEPQVLVLDEPTGGLDSDGMQILWSVVADWRRAGRMVLMTSHQLALLERRVDRVVIFRRGRIAAAGSPDELRRQANLRQRVTWRLAGEDLAGEVAAFVRAVSEWGRCEVEEGDGVLVARVEASGLLELLYLAARHAAAVTDVRIEEPGLTQVYEQLLEEER